MITITKIFCQAVLACSILSQTVAFLQINSRSVARANYHALQMMSDEKKTIGIGVIGCGRIGKIHANSAAFRTPGAKLVAVSDVFEEAGNALVKDFNGIPKYYKDYVEMIKDPEVDAIIVCSPTPYHVEQIKCAAENAKHVFCEKPVSNDIKLIDECVDDVAKAGVKLMVGFQRRFDTNFAEIKDQIEAGAIGKVRTFTITSRDPAPPPADYLAKSGGVFLDMTSHDFDIARFMVGSEVEEVYVKGAAHEEAAQTANDLDTAVTMLHFKNGVFGTIENSRRCTFGYDQRIEVFGEKGALFGVNKFPKAVVAANESGISKGLPFSFFMDRYADAYVGAMNAFVSYINDGPGADRASTAADGRASVVLGFAAQKSADEGRPVKVDEVDV